MFLTNILLKKVKSKIVMVALQSTGSPHRIISFRERTAPKKEIIFFDPLVDMECVYKEDKKLHGMKRPINITKTYNEHTYGTLVETLENKNKKA